jgi:outer membrane receptor for ferrienterochelin and colicins
MRTIILSFLALITFNSISIAGGGETDANIIGDVQCKGQHIPFVNVTIDGTTIGTTTDATGHFQLTNVPVGTFTVRVSGVGYKSTTQIVTTQENVTQEIKFEVVEDILNIEGVVVSADRNQSNRAEAPVIVTSISPALFEQTQSVNLAEGLNFTPGLRTESNCQNCGFTQLRMNGMEGPYTQILMNSRPVFSGLAGSICT